MLLLQQAGVDFCVQIDRGLSLNLHDGLDHC